jgi:hypothetical protein
VSVVATLPTATIVVWVSIIAVGTVLALVIPSRGERWDTLLGTLVVVPLVMLALTWMVDSAFEPGGFSGDQDTTKYQEFDHLGNDPPPSEPGCYYPC